MRNKTNKKIYEELGEGKSFLLTDYKNYEEYTEWQKELNERKFRWGCNDFWSTFEKIGKKVLSRITKPTLGLCHGVRGGKEVDMLSKNIQCKVIGTEIGDNKNNDKKTYDEIFTDSNSDGEVITQWDFHNIKDDWIGKVDVIYSNSLDHSYDPIYALNQWAKCLKETGIIVLHWSKEGYGKTEAIENKTYSMGDPFEAPINIYKKLINDHTPLKIEGIYRGWNAPTEEEMNRHSVYHLVLELK